MSRLDNVSPIEQLLVKLGRIGIDCIEQVLLCVPRAYIDYSEISTLGEALPREGICSEARLFSLICTSTPSLIINPKKRFELMATDGALSVRIVIFLQSGVDVAFWKAMRVGDRFTVHGVLQVWGGQLQITRPELVEQWQLGKVVPLYPGRRGLIGADTIKTAVALALKRIEDAVNHIIVHFDGLSEQEIIEQGGLDISGLRTLLLTLHRPESVEEGNLAQTMARRLAAFGVVWVAKSQKRRREACETSRIPVTMEHAKELMEKLPRSLTDGQKRAIGDIIHDLSDEHPMRRVLSGDVGCGKTYAYMIPAVAAQRAGALVCVLTPNSLLVDQFVRECKASFGEDLPVLAITGTSKKNLLIEGNPILVGTTALLDRLARQSLVPGFLVIDEQQKFSVEQKTALSNSHTNLLEATATPIPRTTALVTHGGMDVSIIRESPVVKKIHSRIVSAAERRRMFAHTHKILTAGGQIAVIYPIVDDDKQERKSVIAAAARWEAEFPGQVGVVHGGMKESEKKEIIQKLKEGTLAICICTTVIEIGLTLPSLRSVVVIHAERYGVSQLHQLRGRAARLGGIGYFFMYLPDPVSEETMARLRLVEEIGDGFVLAERDAQARGYGDLNSESDRQHGGSRSMLFYGLMLRPEDIHQFA